MELNKQPESKMHVRFHDCDPFNHLNNSRYIDYIVAARGDQLIQYYGFDIYDLLKKEQLGWVTAQTQIAYLYPAFVMEEITIQTRLIDYSPKSLLLEACIWNHDKTILKAVMWARLVHFNLVTQKSQEHTAGHLALFERIVYPADQHTHFETRVNLLKQSHSSS